MKRLWADFAQSWMLLTRVPLPRRFVPGVLPSPARSVWCFPLVGALTGAGAGAIYAACDQLGMPPLLAALWTVAAQLLITGALHEDGLADTADGFGGGHSREQKLAIMRDSRIGSYGVLALILSLAIRVAAIGAIGDGASVLGAMTAAGALGRGAIIVVLARIRPARPDGLASSLGDPPAAVLATGAALAGLIAFAALPARVALAASAVSLLSGLVLARLARIQVGGYTGDVLGAAEQLAECGALTVAAIFSG
ncbi:MAG: adenosylcobinamide-GDP ribazoletransferase [Acetobacteraceae bacterium]|nr:adenosylcobinamide-GDP ribazoletransferase [Acetobacteraceae bacterium]